MAFPLLLISCLALISCGGGSSSNTNNNNTGSNLTYNGSTSAATVDSSNADKLAVAATGGTSQAIASGNAPVLRSSPVVSRLLELSALVGKKLSLANRTANQPVNGICSSGSIDATYNADYSRVTLVYSNCAYSGGYGSSIVMNGTAIYNNYSDGSYSIQYINFTATYLGETYSLDMTLSCDAYDNCTYTTDYAGPDGRTYRVDGVTVTSTGTYSYSVTARVYDPDYGYVTIDADVTFGSCAGGVPESGSITYTGSAGTSGSVVFNSCDSFTVTVDGVATDYNWSDYLS